MLGPWENAQSLIMSLNASGFLLFSPYTHHWPMTHQPLDLHSKPLFHYPNHEASFLEGWRANLWRLTVYHCGPLLVSDVHKTRSTSVHQNTAHAGHFSLAGCAQRSCLSLLRAAKSGRVTGYLPASRQDGTQSSVQTDVTFFQGKFVKDVVCPHLTICHRLFNYVLGHIFQWISWPKNKNRKTFFLFDAQFFLFIFPPIF